jgi:peptidoglycan hydrolase CwlO-like protein
MFLSKTRTVLLLGGAIFIVIIASTLMPYVSSAQTATDDVAARRAARQAQLDQVEAQISKTQTTLTGLHGQHQSIQNDINILDTGIKKAQLQVQASQIQIQALSENITVHASTIGQLSGKLSDEQASLAQIVRETHQVDDLSLVELVFSAQDVSDFFGDLDSFATLKQQLGASSQQLNQTKSAAETEKSALEDQKTQTQKLEAVQAAAKQSIVDQQNQKKALLAQTKGQESTYQSIFDQQQKTATQIRAELFALAGGNGTISLPNAITLAKQAGAATGVRPAVILGILKQETNLGQNLGNGVWTVDMSPTRDQPVFKVIMAKLGLDPNSVKVSKAQSGGWGGAMGPSQFIPSTWACYAGYINTTTGSCGKGTDGSYAGPWAYDASKDRLAKDAGHPNTPSNPYNNLDAFTATALLLADNGANAGTPAAERLAALRYYAGWGGATNPAYAFYGDGVMSYAAQFQSDIDTLSGS